MSKLKKKIDTETVASKTLDFKKVNKISSQIFSPDLALDINKWKNKQTNKRKQDHNMTILFRELLTKRGANKTILEINSLSKHLLK